MAAVTTTALKPHCTGNALALFGERYATIPHCAGNGTVRHRTALYDTALCGEWHCMIPHCMGNGTVRYRAEWVTILYNTILYGEWLCTVPHCTGESRSLARGQDIINDIDASLALCTLGMGDAPGAGELYMGVLGRTGEKHVEVKRLLVCRVCLCNARVVRVVLVVRVVRVVRVPCVCAARTVRLYCMCMGAAGLYIGVVERTGKKHVEVHFFFCWVCAHIVRVVCVRNFLCSARAYARRTFACLCWRWPARSMCPW